MTVVKRLWALWAALAVLVFAGSIGSAGAVPARVAARGAAAVDCQPFAARACLLPFPNNLFTRPDRTSTTGLRVSLPAGAMPINRTGRRVSVAPSQKPTWAMIVL